MSLFKRKSEDKPSNNIFDIPEDDLLVQDAPFDSYAIVSNQIVHENLEIRWLYRETPYDNSFPDSGWRIFSGFESEEYLENPNNFTICSLQRIANYQPEVGTLLWGDVGAAFEKTPQNEKFLAVTN